MANLIVDYEDGREILIDITGCMFSPGLFSRKIWEAIFREVDANNFESLDSFLCDLRSFQKIIEDGFKTIYWHHHPDGMTTISRDFLGQDCFKIELEKNQISITKITK